MGKVFVQDKEKLLQLANSIASSKEHNAREKVDKVKSIVSSSQVKQQIGKSTSKYRQSTSDRIRAAKELVTARKAKHKREKARARKADGRSMQQKDSPVSGGDGKSEQCRQSAASAPTPIKRKRVLFA